MMYIFGIIIILMSFISYSAVYAYFEHGFSEEFNEDTRLTTLIVSSIALIPIIGWVVSALCTFIYSYGFKIGNKVYFCRRNN